MQSVQNADVEPKSKVLVRCDLDVPINEGEIEDTYRLDCLLPTLKLIIEKGATPVIVGHMGRPADENSSELSTKQLLPYFNQNLGEGKFELLENLRFDSRETSTDENGRDGYAKGLIEKSGAKIYVNESFADCHRDHASMTSLPKFLPTYAGLRLQKEIETLSKILQNPTQPLVAILGGIKLESKKPLINKFVEIADQVLVGGRLGIEWNEKVPPNLHLPGDYAQNQKDIGPATAQDYAAIITTAGTVVWAGPMGAFEQTEFSAGTKEITQAVANATTQNQAFTLVGGGDTISAINQLGDIKDYSFVSTGGGAMLKFLAQGTLPGIEALNGPNPH